MSRLRVSDLGPDVLCIGEALVDFLPDRAGRKVRDVESWLRCTGGAPANVSVGVARLGGRSALLGVVGEDEFGHFLKESLAGEGVDVTRLRQTSEGKTGLVFISLTETGERSFSFHRTRAAELFMGAADVDLPYVRSARVVHCGTNSLLWPEARGAALQMVREAAAGGQVVSCDPNLRLHLWADPGELRGLIRELVPSCTVFKLSEEEVAFVTGESDVEAALSYLEGAGVALAVVTRGERGATFRFGGETRSVPAPKVPVVDATGAGDGFTAGLLFGLGRRAATAAEVRSLSADTIEGLASFACVVGAQVVTQLGAVRALPRAAELSASWSWLDR